MSLWSEEVLRWDSRNLIEKNMFIWAHTLSDGEQMAPEVAPPSPPLLSLVIHSWKETSPPPTFIMLTAQDNHENPAPVVFR